MRAGHARAGQGTGRRGVPDGGAARPRGSRCGGGSALGHYTHEKSSVGCAAALATLDVIRDEGLLHRSRELGAHELERLRRMQSVHTPIRAVRGLGVSFGVEVASPALAEALMYRCLTNGLSCKVGGGNVLTLCPPLTITQAELDAALDVLDRAFESPPAQQ